MPEFSRVKGPIVNPDLLSKMEDNILEVKELYEANEIIEYPFIEFHILIALATENPMFAIVIRTLRAAFSLAKHPRNRYQLETIQYHQNILEAIKSRDPVAARELMQQHLAQMRHLYEGGILQGYGDEKRAGVSPGRIFFDSTNRQSL